MNFEIGAAVGGKKRVVPIYLDEAGRDAMPPVLGHPMSIDAHRLKPEQVADQIAEAVGTTA